MALDGLFLRAIKCELEKYLIGSKVDKVYQPSAEELVLSLRTRTYGGKKLLLCTRANSPRVHLTEIQYENPPVPPMLCMLLRKRLGGATLSGIRQSGSDRILFIDFSATNEMGDKEKLTLVIEIMAQYSNVILVDEEGKIIDALKRVDYTKSSVRLVLPGVDYQLPPAQEKLDIFENDATTLVSGIKEKPGKALSSAVLSTIMGVSPVVSRQIALQTVGDDKTVAELDVNELATLVDVLRDFKSKYENGAQSFYLLKDENDKPFDFSFMPITQYGTAATIETYDNAGALLDYYYARRDSIERMAHRTADLRKLLQNAKERIARKTDNQRLELAACADRETLRINAELINANLYRLEKGAEYYELENYYDENKLFYYDYF